MKSLRSTIGTAAVAVALIAAVGAPAVAVARPAPSKRVVRQYRVQARNRLQTVRINARVITQKLNRYSFIASKVESAGADVTAVRGHIADSRAHVTSATVLATAGAALLKSVPYSPNRRRVFMAANRKFAAASWQLKLARADKRRAAADLWPLVKKYHLAWKFRWAEFK